jgi:uncharacterized membrane protein YhdT
MAPLSPVSRRTEHRDREHQCRLVLWFVLVPIHACLLGWIAWRYSPTPDEVAHLGAGLGIWELGRFDHYPVNPPLVKLIAAIPVLVDRPQFDWHRFSDDPTLRREWDVGRDFVYANGSRSLWYFTIARWACIPFSLIGLVYCFRWSAEIFGALSGTVAAALWCFSPNILGNAAQIAPDAAAAALGLVAGFHFRQWLLQPNWDRALFAGLVLGAAQLTYGVFPLLWLIGSVRSRRGSRRTRFAGTQALQLLLLLVTSLFVLNAGYGFEGSFMRLGSHQFVSKFLAGAESPGNRFRGTAAENIPVPVPGPYLQGLDIQRRDFEGGWRPMYSYLRGEHRLGGWWYYYCYGLCVKVPLGAWFIALTSAGAPHVRRLLSGRPAWFEIAILMLPAIVLFVVASSQTGFTRYLRYVLPCFPFAFVWMSRFASPLVWRRRPATMVLGAAGLTAMICSSLLVYPHSLAFFNMTVGGPLNGHLHLLDSNSDASQDMKCLKDWLTAHPRATPFYLAHSSVLDARTFGIEARSAPKFLPNEDVHLEAGWYGVSTNHLHGYDSDAGPWQYFRALQPIDRAGYSILIYHVNDTH